MNIDALLKILRCGDASHDEQTQAANKIEALRHQNAENDLVIGQFEQKADSFDVLAPELASLHDVCASLGCPAGERIVPWAARELERMTSTAEELKRQNRELVTEIRIRGDVISALQNSVIS
jgi:hypothetical protein